MDGINLRFQQRNGHCEIRDYIQWLVSEMPHIGWNRAAWEYCDQIPVLHGAHHAVRARLVAQK